MKGNDDKFIIKLIVALLLIAVLLIVLLRSQQEEKEIVGFTVFKSQPIGVTVNTSTPVIFTAEIIPNSKLIKQSVKLLRQTPEGWKEVGTLRDDGLLADKLANDNQYTLQLILNEASSGTIIFQASAAYRGMSKPDLSATYALDVSPSTEKSLLLTPPTHYPLALMFQPGSKQNVTFNSRVTGTNQPPTSIQLWEVDSHGKRIVPALGLLYDDGKNADKTVGDYYYSASFSINSDIEGEKHYQVTADYLDTTVVSPVGSLIISRYPIGPARLDIADAIKDTRTGQKFASGELLVKFRSGLSAQKVEAILKTFNANVIGSLPSIGVLEIAVPAAIDANGIKQAVHKFKSLPDVDYAEPNHVLSVGSFPVDKPCTSNTDTECDWAAIKVHAPEAWPIGEGRIQSGPAIIVAVVDTGVNIDTNPSGPMDLPSQAVLAGFNAEGGGGTGDASGHGTSVARVIAARRNGQGITGIAPKAKILPIKVSQTGLNYWSHVASGIGYAASNGARVINVSLWDFGQQIYEPSPNSLNTTIANATTNAVLVVGIAGNTIGNTCTTGRVAQIFHGAGGLVVGATDFNNNRWGNASSIGSVGSGYGVCVDIAAPGQNVCTGVTGSNTCIGNLSLRTGTSFSAPQVSGAAAILFGLDPSRTVADVKTRLISTATQLGTAFCPGGSGQCAGLLNIIAAIGPPEITSDGGGETAVKNVAENTSVVTTVVASDPNGTALTYSISGGAEQALFTLNPTTHVLSFTTAPDFELPTDSNQDNVYVVIVQVSNGSITDSQTITITVTDVPEPVGNISDTDAVTNSVLENASNNTLVHITAHAVDPDGVSVSYSLDNDAGGRFKIDPSSGIVSVANGSLLDYESTAPSHSYSIIVRATSTDGSFSTQGFTIDVTDAIEPIDIAMVLDRSGSMLWAVPPSSALPPSRLDELRAGVDMFLTDLNSNGLQIPAGSSFGLNLFSNTVLQNTVLGNSMIAFDNLQTNDVGTELDPATLHSGEWAGTSVGDGVRDGLAKLADTSLAVSNAKVLVLFTDGEQNTSPFVTDDGQGICSTRSTTISNCVSNPEIIPDGVKIISVGIGDPSSSYHQTLQNLATNSQNGTYLSANAAANVPSNFPCTANLQQAFECAAAIALSSNSPELVSFSSGKLSDMPINLDSFDINRDVDLLLLSIAFDQQIDPAILKALSNWLYIEKDGVDVSRHFQVASAGGESTHVLVKTKVTQEAITHLSHLSHFNPEGHYTVRLTKPKGVDGELAYRVMTFADDHNLHMERRVSNPAEPQADKIFTPSMRLTWKGRPLDNAVVTMQILQPGDDLGDVLAKAPKVDLGRRFSSKDAVSIGYRKYLKLLKEPEFLLKLNMATFSQAMHSLGQGQFEAGFNPNNISGIYQVRYQVVAEDPEFGKIQRIAVQSVYVRPGEINVTESVVSKTVSGNTITINFRPKTNYGKYIGPAQTNAFKFEGKGVKHTHFEEDGQDGSYKMILIGDPNALITVEFLGQTIYQGEVSKFGAVTTTTDPQWSYWMLLLFIVIAMLLLLQRMLRGGSQS